MRNVRRNWTRFRAAFVGIIALAGLIALAGCTPPLGQSDVTPPTVTVLLPLADATAVATNGIVVATFSEDMDAATITAANFTVNAGTTAVAGTVTWAAAAKSATFTPTTAFAGLTLFTATISTGVKDVAGNLLAAAKVWSFTTGATPDTTPPTVVSNVPAAAATAVVLNTTVSITFSEALDPATVLPSTVTLSYVGGAVPGGLTYAANVVTFTPANPLVASTDYTATVTTGVKDLAGNAIATAYSFAFTTGVAPDTTAPTVVSVSPLDAATGVVLTDPITVTFSKAMDPATIIAANITLKVGAGLTPVAGTVGYNAVTKVATFTPSVALNEGLLYTSAVSVGVKDLAGNALALVKQWTFTTTGVGIGPARVFLGTAGNFVVLAKSAISNVATSAITGDIGVSPAAQSFITGFPLTGVGSYATTPEVIGKVYAADQAPPTPSNMTTAISDMQTAYTDAAGRPTPTQLNRGVGNLGGDSIPPGLYKFTSTVTIPSNATISGGPNDVWIFQITGDLTVSSGVIVTLTSGALAKNIFWQVSGVATLGTTSEFKGVILCQTAINFQTDSKLIGRALAQTSVALAQTTANWQ